MLLIIFHIELAFNLSKVFKILYLFTKVSLSHAFKSQLVLAKLLKLRLIKLLTIFFCFYVKYFV